VDETYVGGAEEGVRGRETNTKFIVGIAIEILSPKGFGRIRLHRLHDVSGSSLIPFICNAVEPGAEVCTDAWKGYTTLAKQGYRHKTINVSHSGDPAHVSLPGVHIVASLLKRWLLGTHQGSVTAQHLDAYLDEFAFRFNRRHSRQRGMLFFRLMENSVATAPARFRPSRAVAARPQ
jgi:transposase-like protein